MKVRILFSSARMLLLRLVRSEWLRKRRLVAFPYHLSKWLVRNIWCALSGMIFVILQSNIKYLVPFLLISVRRVWSLTEVYGGPIIWSITSSMLRAVGRVSPTFSFSCMWSLLSCVRIWRKALKVIHHKIDSRHIHQALWGLIRVPRWTLVTLLTVGVSLLSVF